MEKNSRILTASLALAVAFIFISPSKEISAQNRYLVTSKKIEADWLHQEELRNITKVSTDGKVTPEQDAIGACDGIKDGGIGFHTKNAKKPATSARYITSFVLNEKYYNIRNVK